MRSEAVNFLALATDYDGTLAQDGTVQESTVSALELLAKSGRKLFLVTGRQLEELLQIFPRHELFDWIIAENGALIYCPRNRELRLLADAVPEEFPAALRERGIENVAAGHSIVATWRPNECKVLEALRDLGLDRQIIFNKDAVMVLPTGVNKASGLAAALIEEQVSFHNVIAVGDAENDLPMLSLCEVGAAVSNALASVKDRADLRLDKDHGAGVEELIAEILRDDLSSWRANGYKRGLLLGRLKSDNDESILLPSMGQSILMAGPSGSGKSTVITGMLERLADAEYEFCILDPEGDYEKLQFAISLGNPHYVPSPDEIFSLLERMHNSVVNLLGVSVDERPKKASQLLRRLQDLRVSKGRPHWFVIDEAHHIFPAESASDDTLVTRPPRTSFLITVHPQHVQREALEEIDVLLAVGKEPDETIRSFCRCLQIQEPKLESISLEHGEVLVWFRRTGKVPMVVVSEPGKTEHKRHIRKYAEGDLGPGSFAFRGPQGRLNLVAQNLDTFVRMAEGVDDETWDFHLNSGDISNWMRSIVKDKQLADTVRDIEQTKSSAHETRPKVLDAIRSRYTRAE